MNINTGFDNSFQRAYAFFIWDIQYADAVAVAVAVQDANVEKEMIQVTLRPHTE